MTMSAAGIPKLQEEIGELMAVLGKKLAYFHTDSHPDGKGPLSQRLIEEMGDVIAAISFCSERLALDQKKIQARAEFKLNLYAVWDRDKGNNVDAVDRLENT